ncbi:MAG: hypothetical protein NTW08_09970 [Gammaproteobacteria bacterium]|nr:hypothetical protein [Gammaproteobacteria bacterium]
MPEPEKKVYPEYKDSPLAKTLNGLKAKVKITQDALGKKSGSSGVLETISTMVDEFENVMKRFTKGKPPGGMDLASMALSGKALKDLNDKIMQQVASTLIDMFNDPQKAALIEKLGLSAWKKRYMEQKSGLSKKEQTKLIGKMLKATALPLESYLTIVAGGNEKEVAALKALIPDIVKLIEATPKTLEEVAPFFDPAALNFSLLGYKIANTPDSHDYTLTGTDNPISFNLQTQYQNARQRALKVLAPPAPSPALEARSGEEDDDDYSFDDDLEEDNTGEPQGITEDASPIPEAVESSPIPAPVVSPPPGLMGSSLVMLPVPDMSFSRPEVTTPIPSHHDEHELSIEALQQQKVDVVQQLAKIPGELDRLDAEEQKIAKELEKQELNLGQLARSIGAIGLELERHPASLRQNDNAELKAKLASFDKMLVYKSQTKGTTRTRKEPFSKEELDTLLGTVKDPKTKTTPRGDAMVKFLKQVGMNEAQIERWRQYIEAGNSPLGPNEKERVALHDELRQAIEKTQKQISEIEGLKSGHNNQSTEHLRLNKQVVDGKQALKAIQQQKQEQVQLQRGLGEQVSGLQSTIETRVAEKRQLEEAKRLEEVRIQEEQKVQKVQDGVESLETGHVEPPLEAADPKPSSPVEPEKLTSDIRTEKIEAIAKMSAQNDYQENWRALYANLDKLQVYAENRELTKLDKPIADLFELADEYLLKHQGSMPTEAEQAAFKTNIQEKVKALKTSSEISEHRSPILTGILNALILVIFPIAIARLIYTKAVNKESSVFLKTDRQNVVTQMAQNAKDIARDYKALLPAGKAESAGPPTKDKESTSGFGNR